jgi:hypothetical protein
MERHTQYQKALENEDKVYEKTSVAFTDTDPQTKTLQLSPASGKVWHLDKIRAWTDEAPPDNTNAGSKTDIDIYINGTAKKIAKRYASEMIGTTYRSSGVAICCLHEFGQRLKITETTNGVYVSATKTGSGTHTLYLEVEGTEL